MAKAKGEIQLEAQEVIPSARRLIKSLRDIGYEFSSAVADVVDNSIEWGESTRIYIDVAFDGDESWVRIVDVGRGMNRANLMEAMRYGSSREYKEDSLGKFGLGLKTASLSQCRFLAVASRQEGKSEINAYCWDMDHIEKTDRWEILPLKSEPLKSLAYEMLEDSPGTVVLWKRLDRLLGYKHPYGPAARKELASMSRELENHLAMVFHRFLVGTGPNKKKIVISINGNKIEPWDPFATKEENTIKPDATKLLIEHEGKKGEIFIQPYILPHQKEFSSAEEFRRAAGPKGWNEQQGFYIYRAGRLIQSGGWCGLRKPDEHTKLARIVLSFPPELDEAFKINIAKMHVNLPVAYRDEIDKMIQPIVKRAREVYDREERGSTLTAAQQTGPHGNIAADASAKTGGGIAGQQSWTLDEIEEKLMSFAEGHEIPVLKRVFARLRRKI